MIDRNSATRMGKAGLWLSGLGLLTMAGLFIRALQFTPVDANQGAAQKIFYVHAPAAILGLGAFFITGIASIFYLWLKESRIDLFAAASAEVGLVFSGLVLITGPIWGKPVWGTWWSWDARLTFTLLLFLLFVGYVVMRGALSDPVMRAKYSSVIGIMGMVLVPFIHVTVYLFQTLHPDPVVIRPGRPQLPDSMLQTFLLAVVAYAVLYLGFVMVRYSVGAMEYGREEALASGE